MLILADRKFSKLNIHSYSGEHIYQQFQHHSFLGENKCVIGLSAAAIQAEFEIGEGTFTLVKFSSGNKPPVKGLQDKPMKLKELIKEMRRQGVDIFPDYDSHCYIEGLPLKDIQTERHLYNCMSLTANSLNFTWSRWNLLSGYDKLIMQVIEG